MKVTVETKKGLEKNLKVFVDKNTINFVVELLFDEARLTIKETFLLAFKFILPFRTVRFFSKSPAFSL